MEHIIQILDIALEGFWHFVGTMMILALLIVVPLKIVTELLATIITDRYRFKRWLENEKLKNKEDELGE